MPDTPTPKRDHPILFSAPMVKALLAGRKSETRRLLPPAIREALDGAPNFSECAPLPRACRWDVGDLLWVREAWKPHSLYAHMKPREMPQAAVFYLADDAYAPSNTRWVTPIHMPRWASRITLLVREARVERVQEITTAACYAEGAITEEWEEWREDAGNVGLPAGSRIEDERDAFANLWNSLHARDGYGWDANPWCVVTRFAVIRGNIDSPDVQRRAAQQREAAGDE